MMESLRPQQEDWDSILPTTAANEAIGFGPDEVRPAATLWEAHAVPAAPPQVGSGGRSIDLRRVGLGVAATLVVALLFVLMHDTLVLREDAQDVETRTAAAVVGRVTGTASRDNIDGTDRASSAPGDGLLSTAETPQSQSQSQSQWQSQSQLQAETEGPIEAQRGEDESRRDVAVSAIQALGLSEPAALRDPLPVNAMTSTATLAATDAANSTPDQECTAAHAALALCQSK